MTRFHRGSLLILLIFTLIVWGSSSTAKAADNPYPYLGNMLQQKATGIEILSTKIDIKITGDRALITCDYQMVNRGKEQTITAAYPAAYLNAQSFTTGFAVSKNGKPLPVKMRRQSVITVNKPNNIYNSYYWFSIPMGANENCSVRNMYFVRLTLDNTQGLLLLYNNHSTGGWIDNGLKKFDIHITDYKPYYNLMLFPELAAQPQTMDYQGNFSYLIDPKVMRQNIHIYYQLRGPEAAIERLTMSKYAQPLTQLFMSKQYAEAGQQLQLMAPTLLGEGIISPADLSMLKIYIAYQLKEYETAGEELDQRTIKDGAYIYYKILNSLQRKSTGVAGQTLQEIGRDAQQDLTVTSVGLLKSWAENNISQYLARPVAPVPPASKPKLHTAVLFITMGLVVVISIIITALMRRTRN